MPHHKMGHDAQQTPAPKFLLGPNDDLIRFVSADLLDENWSSRSRRTGGREFEIRHDLELQLAIQDVVSEQCHRIGLVPTHNWS